MATIIDGKKTALEIRNDLKEKIARLKIFPKLAVVLAGDDEASKIYVKNKQKAAFEVGIETILYTFDNMVTQNQLETLIDDLNNDADVNGILIQLPLPKHINAQKLLNKVCPLKDVDGFHPFNIGLLQNGDSCATIAATPKGVLRLIKQTNIDLTGKNALVIGRSNIVGKPMSMLLLNENCTVTIAHSKTSDLRSLCQNADIVVSATGCPRLVKADWLKKGAVVIDVGICRDESGKLCGDVDFDKALEVASYITPVPGGVGPMTIAMLLENVVDAYLKQHQQ
ncbi:MAG: bifunctional methylenetetrahydrofolate dehydrogenase/methenyltetrahydrofolate cyclohydrolase FolD [Alphaproteobacteria bacterium]|nr:bifunctional methylenetetrahydrofolate dehydrogenase/methenyltetrahydrofolate cyclohydrolase FolD [Alphaproteobacteria bacterium]